MGATFSSHGSDLSWNFKTASKTHHQGNTLTQQGKLLNGLAANMGTILEEQQAQRMDIRSLHTDMQSLHSEVHASKDELKAAILSARAEAKADSIDVKATVLKKNQSYERRITNLEEHEGVENPDKN